MAEQQDLVFVPLGGVGEIGMNAGLYGFGTDRGRKWLMVDCGVTFGDPAETPGIDLILPDIRFAESIKRDLLGIVLTHVHEDHYGALLDLWPKLRVPVYATPFAAALLEARRAGEPGAPNVPVTVIPVDGRFDAGPFNVEFVPVAHSIPEATALALRTPAGLVVHTGDWKMDLRPVLGRPTDEARMRALGEEGVAAVLGDSTNAMREGVSPSETDVAAGLAEVMAGAKGRVAATIFASNVGRLRALAEAAEKNGRNVVVVGRAMQRFVEVATETGYLEGLPPFLGPDAYGYLPRENVLALLTGSQGEPRAALARIASDEHPEIALSSGDLVIFSSRTIPGNEKAVGKIVNGLVQRGIAIVTDDGQHLVHASGHPRRGEIRELYGWLKPQLAVPVHGEPMHLAAHAALAREIGVPKTLILRNGQMARIAGGKPEIVDSVPVGRTLKDGGILISAGDQVIPERRRLSFAGMVTVGLSVNSRGDISEGPEIRILGIPARAQDGVSMVEITREAISAAMDGIPRARRKDATDLEQSLQKAVRSAIAAAWGKRPNVQVMVFGGD